MATQDSLFDKWTKTIGYPHAKKESNLESHTNDIQTLTQHNYRPKCMSPNCKIFRRKQEKIFVTSGCVEFLDTIPKALSVKLKINKLVFIQIKIFTLQSMPSGKCKNNI